MLAIVVYAPQIVQGVQYDCRLYETLVSILSIYYALALCSHTVEEQTSCFYQQFVTFVHTYAQTYFSQYLMMAHGIRLWVGSTCLWLL